MNFFYELERKYSKYAIKGLMKYFSILFIIGFLLNVSGDIYYKYLALDMYRVFHGEVWRLFTWLVYPPSTSWLFGIIMIYLYYYLGVTLEKVWGTFRFNVFMFMGVFIHIIGASILYLMFGNNLFIIGITPYNIIMSIFLAYSLTFPEQEFLIYFVLPVKAKVLAIFYMVIILFNLIKGAPVEKFTIIASILNFVIFYFITGRLLKPKYSKPNVKNKVVRKVVNITHTYDNSIHKCKTCGKTSKNNDDMEFRYCSKCLGNYEYCSEHIFTHLHIR